MAVVELHGRAMASEVHLIAVDSSTDQLDAAVMTLRELEERWSRFIPTSDISRINAVAGSPVVVGFETLVLVDAMVDAWRATGGRFDPSVLPALVRIGYEASREDATRRTTLPPAAHGLGRMGDVVVDHERSTVMVPTGTALDPGGIGKGLAADRCVVRLLDGGAAGALVGIGGDLAMGGEPPCADGWLVRIEHADRTAGELCRVAVSGGGVATSSTCSRRWVVDGHEHHHLIDPATGLGSATDLASVTVFAATGWWAEASATAALLSSAADVVRQLEHDHLSGVAVAADGAVLRTADLAAIELRDPVWAR